MNKINFQNLPSTTTPINATNMNLLQQYVDEGKAEGTKYSNVDLNSITQNSIGSFTSNCTNKPFNSDGYIMTQVIDTNTMYQTATNTTGTLVKHRFKTSGTWGAWQIDYEEGTWTPVVTAQNETAPTVTYTIRAANYKRIGKLLYYDFYIRCKITALNGTNNYGLITGLPYYPSSSYKLGQNSVNLAMYYKMFSNETDINLITVPGADGLRALYEYGAKSNKLIVTPTSYCELGGDGWFEINQ